MLTTDTYGVYPIAPTPFLTNGDIDFNSISRLVSFYKEVGAKGVTILGVLGEASKMNAEEAVLVINAYAKNCNGLDLIVGVNSPGFASMKYLADSAMRAGACAVLLGAPSNLRTDDQIIGYYNTAASVLGPETPFIIQDYPLVLQVVFSNHVIKEIINTNQNCAGLKHEDWPGLEKIRTLHRWMDEGSVRRVPIVTGNSGLFLDFECDNGVNGAMTGYAFPEMLVEAVGLSRIGKKDEMHDLYDAHLPYLRYEAQPKVGVGIRKYVLKRRGIFTSDTQRAPFIPLSDASMSEIDYLLDRLTKKLGITSIMRSYDV